MLLHHYQVVNQCNVLLLQHSLLEVTHLAHFMLNIFKLTSHINLLSYKFPLIHELGQAQPAKLLSPFGSRHLL